MCVICFLKTKRRTDTGMCYAALCDFFAPLCNFWAASLCNYFAPLGNQKKLPHFVILCLYNTWRVSCGGNSLKTKLQKIMIRKRPHPFMTSSFSPFWYWKYDTLISLDCVAHFRPNSVRMILRPKSKLCILNIDLNHLWRYHLVHFGTGNMTLLHLSIVWLILDQIRWE